MADLGMDRVYETWALQNLLLRNGFSVKEFQVTPAKFKQGEAEERCVAVFLRTQGKECPINVGPLAVSNEVFIAQLKAWVESARAAPGASTAEKDAKEAQLQLLYQSTEVYKNRAIIYAHLRKFGIQFIETE
jgi:hypothetical protein